MKRISILALIVVCCGTSNTAKAVGNNSSRQAALSVVSLLLEGDKLGAEKYFHPDAESKSAGKGSAIAKLKKSPAGIFEKVALESVVFFNQADIAKLKKSYPDNMWQRVSQRIDKNLGCLIVVGIPNREEKGMLLLVFDEADGQPRIIYTDDN